MSTCKMERQANPTRWDIGKISCRISLLMKQNLKLLQRKMRTMKKGDKLQNLKRGEEKSKTRKTTVRMKEYGGEDGESYDK